MTKRRLSTRQLQMISDAAAYMHKQFNLAIWYTDRGIKVLNDPHHQPTAQNNFSDADHLAAWNFREARYSTDGALAEWHNIKKYFA